MKTLILGLVLGCCLPLIAAVVFIKSGRMPVATKGPPLPFERYLAHAALDAALEREPAKAPPMTATEATLTAGAKVYRAQCMVCHGSLDGPATPTARGMFPQPPALVRLDRTGVTDDSAWETYWKARNGIRLTGMPGYVDSLSDTELWQVSLLLQHAHELPASASALLKE